MKHAIDKESAARAAYERDLALRPNYHDGTPPRTWDRLDKIAQSSWAAPYPFCRTPDKCAGKGYCPNDPACND